MPGSHRPTRRTSVENAGVLLSRDEIAGLVDKTTRIITSLARNQPTPDRRLHLLSTVLIPIDEPAPEPV